MPPANSVENVDACDQEMRFGVLQQGDTLPKELVEEAIEDDDDEEEDDDDDDGWITPDNIKSIKQDLAGGKEAANVTVGCLTTDFAMQVTQSFQSIQFLYWPTNNHFMFRCEILTIILLWLLLLYSE